MNALSLREISHDEVLAQNILLGTARELEFRIGSAQYGLTFYRPEFTPQAALTFSLQIGEYLLGVELEAIPPLVLQGSTFPVAEYELMPPDVAQVVFEAFISPFLSSLCTFLGTEVRLHSMGPLPTGIERSLGAVLSQNGQSSWVRARVHASTALWGIIAHKLQSCLPVPTEDYSSIPLSASLQIGASRVPFGKLQDLDFQDILLFDRGITPNSSDCIVHFGDHLSFNAKLNNNTITLQSLMNKTNAREDLPPSASAGASPSLDAFAVHLTFEVGEKEIPIGELRALRAGYTFEMDNPLESPVTIKANGSIIGTGELVQVADRIGVRVLDFSQQRAVARPKAADAIRPEQPKRSMPSEPSLSEDPEETPLTEMPESDIFGEDETHNV